MTKGQTIWLSKHPDISTHVEISHIANAITFNSLEQTRQGLLDNMCGAYRVCGALKTWRAGRVTSYREGFCLVSSVIYRAINNQIQTFAVRFAYLQPSTFLNKRCPDFPTQILLGICKQLECLPSDVSTEEEAGKDS